VKSIFPAGHSVSQVSPGHDDPPSKWWKSYGTLLGVVLNNINISQDSYYYYYSVTITIIIPSTMTTPFDQENGEPNRVASGAPILI
jgi:hypothetical protein